MQNIKMKTVSCTLHIAAKIHLASNKQTTLSLLKISAHISIQINTQFRIAHPLIISCFI